MGLSYAGRQGGPRGANLFLNRRVDASKVRLRNFRQINLAVNRTQGRILRRGEIRVDDNTRCYCREEHNNDVIPDPDHGEDFVMPLPSCSVVYFPGGRPVHSSTRPLTQWA